MKLDGAVAVVIGGACGMGKSYCESLLKNGSKVIIGDILMAEGEETRTELASAYGEDKVHFRKCNGICESDIRAALMDAKTRWGRLDVVINHVGILNETNWKRMLEINVGSAILSAQVTEEILGKNNGGPGGVLVHTASRAGVIPSHLLPRYSATKAAMVQYTRALMHPSHYNRHGIRMMCICPGITKTNFILDSENSEKSGMMFDIVKAAMKMKEETNSWVQPEWVGDLLIEMLEKDDQMAGVAAEINSRTPVFHYQGEWKDVQ